MEISPSYSSVFVSKDPRNEVILQRNMFGGTKRKALQIFYVSPPKKGILGLKLIMLKVGCQNTSTDV